MPYGILVFPDLPPPKGTKNGATQFDLSRVVELRKKAGENQATYWSRFGVTQSGGSRYEQGRKIPAPVKVLMAVSWYASSTRSP